MKIVPPQITAIYCSTVHVEPDFIKGVDFLYDDARWGNFDHPNLVSESPASQFNDLTNFKFFCVQSPISLFRKFIKHGYGVPERIHTVVLQHSSVF